MKKFIFILFCWLGITSIFAGTIDPFTDDIKYIEYGQKFKNVVVISGKEKDGTIFFASAVVINDHFILTAAHVVQNAQDCFILINKKKYNIIDIKCHKNFQLNNLPRADIAVGYCDKKIGLESYPKLYTDIDELKKTCSIAGFGLTGTFKTGAMIRDGKIRAGSNTIDRIDRDVLVCSPSLYFKLTELEFLIANGDSGGGLFIDGKLAAINSSVSCVSGTNPNSDYFSESYHVRISQYIDWIEENTK